MGIKLQFARLCVCIAVFSVALFGYFTFYLPEPKATYVIADTAISDTEFSLDNGIETVGYGITPVSIPKSAERGHQTSVYFQGTPDEEYQIRVYYASGLSTSKSFSPVKADQNGVFCWTWSVSPNTRQGDIRIIVTGENCRICFKMSII